MRIEIVRDCHVEMVWKQAGDVVDLEPKSAATYIAAGLARAVEPSAYVAETATADPEQETATPAAPRRRRGRPRKTSAPAQEPAGE